VRSDGSDGYVARVNLPDVLRLEPLMVDRPWGGRRLEGFGRVLPPSVPVGESWEIADLPPADGSSQSRCTSVAEGPLAGATLSELIGRFGAEFLGSAGPMPDGRFPLLVKLLDAREHLSVQVHPPADIADQDPAIRAKSESWYVMATEPGSKVWFDVRTDVELSELEATAGTSTFVSLLGEVPARVGDFHHIPAGRVHALGAGVVVLEIQTPSDTTFRIYDWNEVYDRPPRELHLAAAVRSIVRGDPSAISVAGAEGSGVRDLVRTPDYWIREHRTDGDSVDLDDRRELRVLTVIDGAVSADSVTLGPGDIRILPASSRLIGPWEAAPGTVLIETGLV
jgi:mannose-6-phosphate isomerase